MKRIGLVLLAIVSALIFVVAGCAPAAPPVEKPPVEKVVWKHASYIPPASLAAWGEKHFLDEIEKRSEGRFKCEHFWSQSLCSRTEQPDALKSGLCQVACFAPCYYPSKTPFYFMTFFPCLFPLAEESRENYLTFMNIINEWLQTPLLKEEFAKWDAIQISENYPGFRTIMSKARIATLEDLKGRKLYCTGGQATLLTKFGVAPVVSLAPGEIYDAISKGVIEGSVFTWQSFWPYRIHEVSNYWITGINVGHSEFSLAVSRKAYEALPGDIKKVFQEVKEEHPRVLADFHIAKKDEAVEAFKKAGIESVEFAAEDNEKLAEAAKEIWKEYVDKLEKQGLPGKKAFNSLQDIIAKHVPGYKPYYL